MILYKVHALRILYMHSLRILYMHSLRILSHTRSPSTFFFTSSLDKPSTNTTVMCILCKKIVTMAAMHVFVRVSSSQLQTWNKKWALFPYKINIYVNPANGHPFMEVSRSHCGSLVKLSLVKFFFCFFVG